MKLNDSDVLKQLYEDLHYLHMSELKELCLTFNIAGVGVKKVLIDRLMIVFGGKSSEHHGHKNIPTVSRAKKGIVYPIAPDALMLYGSYKNSYEQRFFFKKLIGNHFHFTAYGIDWLRGRWVAGNPPTYQEFADYWQQEYERRKTVQVKPKDEWAYINFVQRYYQEYPLAPQDVVMVAWNKERQHRKDRVVGLLKKVHSNKQ